mmetsp:Transcript_54452/g.101805  ORF Transcript_54452/g.101805 Transcript_54452/m.101805 type:complete len:183 (-) Transcript_54452:192-740(-)
MATAAVGSMIGCPNKERKSTRRGYVCPPGCAQARALRCGTTEASTACLRVRSSKSVSAAAGDSTRHKAWRRLCTSKGHKALPSAAPAAVSPPTEAPTTPSSAGGLSLLLRGCRGAGGGGGGNGIAPDEAREEEAEEGALVVFAPKETWPEAFPKTVLSGGWWGSSSCEADGSASVSVALPEL